MAELSPEAKRALAAMRDIDDPTLAERASGDAAVRRMLEAHGLHKPAPVYAHTALKLTWWLGAALAATVGFFAMSGPRPAPRTEAAAPATLERAEPLAAPSTTPQPPPAAEVVAPPRATASAPRKPSKTADDSLAAELRFVASVDAELRAGAYERALKLLQQHRTNTPLLQEERSAMRVLAMCGRDHDARARRERDQFLKLHPSSLLSARVRAACTEAP